MLEREKQPDLFNISRDGLPAMCRTGFFHMADIDIHISPPRLEETRIQASPVAGSKATVLGPFQSAETAQQALSPHLPAEFASRIRFLLASCQRGEPSSSSACMWPCHPHAVRVYVRRARPRRGHVVSAFFPSAGHHSRGRGRGVCNYAW